MSELEKKLDLPIVESAGKAVEVTYSEEDKANFEKLADILYPDSGKEKDRPFSAEEVAQIEKGLASTAKLDMLYGPTYYRSWLKKVTESGAGVDLVKAQKMLELLANEYVKKEPIQNPEAFYSDAEVSALKEGESQDIDKYFDYVFAKRAQGSEGAEEIKMTDQEAVELTERTLDAAAKLDALHGPVYLMSYVETAKKAGINIDLNRQEERKKKLSTSYDKYFPELEYSEKFYNRPEK